MSPARVLVVDDESDITTILALALRRAGYQVSTAGDGLQALEVIAQEPPDLVILDVMMPRLDGFDTLQRLRESAPTAAIPVILLTARAQGADRIKGLERGADDYVTKPFEPSEIVVRVQAMLARTTSS
jgi:DNA-binding response OmpR family regulator